MATAPPRASAAAPLAPAAAAAVTALRLRPCARPGKRAWPMPVKPTWTRRASPAAAIRRSRAAAALRRRRSEAAAAAEAAAAWPPPSFFLTSSATPSAASSSAARSRGSRCGARAGGAWPPQQRAVRRSRRGLFGRGRRRLGRGVPPSPTTLRLKPPARVSPPPPPRTRRRCGQRVRAPLRPLRVPPLGFRARRATRRARAAVGLRSRRSRGPCGRGRRLRSRAARRTWQRPFET
mmetsp:Transcript_13236/g.46921  ORF Transcript_13236/g.46921 Transcript_13236/m.46921 type:complete len:235 (-) Transcript_13236:256-960(-)